MGHYINRESHTVKFIPGSVTTGFREWWSKQIPCTRDGCRSVNVKIDSDQPLTKLREDRFFKTCDKKYADFLDYPGSYTCNAVLIGIVGWRAERKVRKVVDHHIREVIESKTYKTKPTKGLKGSTIYAIGKFAMCYDARDYDPMEHGDYPHDEW